MHWVSYFIFASCAFLAEALIGKKVRVANDYEYPFVVSIGYKDPSEAAEDNHICMGILILDKNILTCAHCLEDEEAGGIQVLIGSVNLHTSESYDVATWTTYDSWCHSNDRRRGEHDDNDIGVLRLSRPVVNPSIKPVTLAASKFDEIDGIGAMIAGFGVSNNGKETSQLMAGSLTVLSRERCRERILNMGITTKEVFDTEFCTTADPFNLGGEGDGGAPVLNMNNELLGIHMGTCPEDSNFQCPKDADVLTNVHLSVDFYRDFIHHFREQL